MLASQIPAKVPLPFANSGTKNTIPTASQIGITAGAASLTDGFPPLTFTPLASGGVPPAGADFNGILNLITAVQQWQSAGGAFKYDSAFSTSIGGYPAGATLTSTSNTVNWLSLVDNNITDPDSGTAANWIALDAYGIGAVTGLTNANVILTPAQYGKTIITLAGTLTGNVQITFPGTTQEWTVINNTSGAFTLSALVSGGTPVALNQGGAAILRGTGTNVVVDALQVGPATAGQQAVPLGQLTGTVGSMANAKMLVTTGSATATFTADQIIVQSALNGNQFILPSFNKTINISTTGIGGMDTGTPPANGAVAIYAAYNPTTGASGLFACNAATVQGMVYGGANLPAGYTATALVSVWITNGAFQFTFGSQRGRRISRTETTIISSTTITAISSVAIPITSAPPNAISVRGSMGITSATAAYASIFTFSDANSDGKQFTASNLASGFQFGAAFETDLAAASTLYYGSNASTGTPTFSVAISSYAI